MLRSSNPDQKYALRRSGSDRSRASIFFSAMDYWILVPVMIMVLIGLYVLNQVAADGVGTTLSYPSGFYRQVGAVLLGLALAIIICLMELPTLRLFGSIIYIVAVILLIYVKIDGYSLRSLTGADSWIRFPVIGSLQPSELAKTGIAMVAGNILAEYIGGTCSLAPSRSATACLIILQSSCSKCCKCSGVNCFSPTTFPSRSSVSVASPSSSVTR